MTLQHESTRWQLSRAALELSTCVESSRGPSMSPKARVHLRANQTEASEASNPIARSSSATIVRRHSGLGAALWSWFLGFQLRGGYMREDCTCARNNMTFTPGSSEGCSERFQMTLKVTSGFPAGLRCEFKNIVLLEIDNPQVELCCRLRECLMV